MNSSKNRLSYVAAAAQIILLIASSILVLTGVADSGVAALLK